jgi:uncharacterized membrane protein
MSQATMALAKPERAAPIRRRRTPPWHRDPWLYVSVALLIVANVVVSSSAHIPFAGPALGFWVVVVYPTYLIATTRIWSGVSGVERAAFGLGAVLLLLLLGGLVMDLLLPLMGVARPLDRAPVLVAVDVLNVALMVWRIRRGRTGGAWLSRLGLLTRRECRVLVLSACCVPLVVAGANQLNNGQGDLVALLGLSGVAATFAVLLWWRFDIRDSVISIVTYLLGLSLLLSTSLRGWYVTGHDIQREYRVFELTKTHGVWDINNFRDAYNACLSISILPTEIWQMVRVDDPYIYKVFFQMLFAVCPVIVYVLARRYWSKRIAVLGVVYFVGFPTFFTDMPFLNRQEMAFIFVGLAYLAVTMRRWGVGYRRAVLVLCGLGIGLSHYSTMYVFVGTLLVAWVAGVAFRLAGRLAQVRRESEPRVTSGWADSTRTVGLVVILVFGAVAFTWGGAITHTSSGVSTTVKDALPQLFGSTSAGGHSADASYGLLPSGQVGPQQLLDQYRKQTLHDRLVDDPGTYLPLKSVKDLPAHATSTPSLPLSDVGKALASVHVPVTALNDVVRALAAKGEQVFVIVGLAVLGLVRWRRRQMGRDFYLLAIGSVVMVGAVTVLPGLSVSYGLLRAFQQALFLIAPILVIGSIALCKPLGRVWAGRVAGIVALVFLVSTIGVMPQVLGGYEAQLNLNNSGLYYDQYYQHPQEVAAVTWLGHQPGTLPVGVQAEATTDIYAFTAPSSVTGSEYITDIFPTLLRKSTWVVLGYATVRTGIATTQYSGDLISYHYPMAPLTSRDDLVYDNGGTRIYK